MVAYWNIETILRAGIIHQFVSYMTINQIKILFLAETKAGGSVSKSGEYWVFLSGKSGREVHGVGAIIHSYLLQSILAVKAISS